MAVPYPPSRREVVSYLNTSYARFGVTTQTREIDLVQGYRHMPMKVLCLGQSRTGTTSLWVALQMLGYTPYNLAAILKNGDVEVPCWVEAMEMHHGVNGKTAENGWMPYGTKEFDKLCGDYDSVIDNPCAAMGVELIKAYPEAKVVLSERPFEEWYVSLQRTVGQVASWRTWPLVAWADPSLTLPWYKMALALEELSFGGKLMSAEDRAKIQERYEEHYKIIREACPKDRLVEIKTGEGWERLCKALGKEVPPVPFPKVNDGNNFIEWHTALWYRAAGLAMLKVGTGLVVAGAVVGVVWLNRLRL